MFDIDTHGDREICSDGWVYEPFLGIYLVFNLLCGQISQSKESKFAAGKPTTCLKRKILDSLST